MQTITITITRDDTTPLTSRKLISYLAEILRIEKLLASNLDNHLYPTAYYEFKLEDEFINVQYGG